jgi:type II secretory pathway pseudopilin PulG
MKGFTLIELMLIMGVIAVTLALSILGLTRFRSGIELNTAHTNIISYISEIKNKSTNAYGTTNNGVLQSTVDFFGVSFVGNDVTALNCDGNFDFSTYSCSNATEQPPIDLGSVTMTITTCGNRIGFKRLTSDLVSLNTSGGLIVTGTCSLQLRHSFTNETKTITIDLVKNTFK